MKKVISIILSAALVLSLTPFGTLNVLAADITEPVEVDPGESKEIDGNLNVEGEEYAATVYSYYDPSSLKVNGNIMLDNQKQNDSSYAVYSDSYYNKASMDISGDVIAKMADSWTTGIFIYGNPGDEDSIIEANIGGNVLARVEFSVAP